MRPAPNPPPGYQRPGRDDARRRIRAAHAARRGAGQQIHFPLGLDLPALDRSSSISGCITSDANGSGLVAKARTSLTLRPASSDRIEQTPEFESGDQGRERDDGDAQPRFRGRDERGPMGEYG